MQNDLFLQNGEKSGKVRRSPENPSGLLRAPIVSLRKSGAGLVLQEVRTSPTATSYRGPAISGPGPDKYKQIKMLEADLATANQSLFEIHDQHDALKATFNAAHNALIEVAGVENYRRFNRTVRKPLYDARFHAGVAWNPVRKTYQELQRWKRDVVRDLQALNEEISQ